MKHLTVLFTLLFFGLSLTGIASAQEATAEVPFYVYAQEAMQKTPQGVDVQNIDIDLGGGFTTYVQLTTPLEGEGPFPTVILFHGSGPYDLNATYRTDFDAPPLSANFLLLAERLGQQGIAVMRFNKRGVESTGLYDTDQIQASTLDVLVLDAEQILELAQRTPEVDKDRIYLYGWSEGAWVAANVAAKHADEIAGLILQGAPQGDIVHILETQQKELMIPYLTETTDADGDGALTLEEIATIPAGPVQYSSTFYLYEPGSPADAPTLNRFVNTDKDDAISIQDELVPMVEMYLTSYSAYLPKVEASHDTAALLAESAVPALLLHGALDGWVPLADAEAIVASAPDTVMLNVYPELGHALSVTDDLATDGFEMMDEGVIRDMVTWIEGEGKE